MASDSERSPEQSAAGENEPKAAGPTPSDSEHITAAAGDTQHATAAGGEITAAARPKTAAGLSLDDFILLNEEIAGMARAGLPLDQGLAALAKDMGSGKLRAVTAEIAVDLQSGFTLPQAVERQSGRLPAYYGRLLAAGIRSGRVSDVLGTMTVYARTLADLRSIVLSALLYPAVVLFLSLGIFVFLGYYLVPQLNEVFGLLHIKQPALTRFTFYVLDHAVWIFVVAPLLLLSAVLVLRYFVRWTPAGRLAWARFWYAVPIVGTLLRSARLASFTDLMGILVDNGVPLPEAFLLAGQSSSDPLVDAGAEQIHEGLSHGISLGVMLRGQKLVPDLVAWMVALGEKRGTLGAALHQAAEMYRRKVELRAGLLRVLLPPFLLILIAGIAVAMYIFGMFLPLTSVYENLGGGKK